MAERERERIGRVVALGRGGQREQLPHHAHHLLLTRPAEAADGRLDDGRRVLGADDPVRRRHHQLVRSGWCDVRIRVVRREESDSTLTVLRQMMPGWRDLKITETLEDSDNEPGGDRDGSRCAGAVGFGPYSANLDPDVKVLRIGGLHPLDPGYPWHVELALIYREGDPGRPAASS